MWTAGLDTLDHTFGNKFQSGCRGCFGGCTFFLSPPQFLSLMPRFPYRDQLFPAAELATNSHHTRQQPEGLMELSLGGSHHNVNLCHGHNSRQEKETSGVFWTEVAKRLCSLSGSLWFGSCLFETRRLLPQFFHLQYGSRNTGLTYRVVVRITTSCEAL